MLNVCLCVYVVAVGLGPVGGFTVTVEFEHY